GPAGKTSRRDTRNNGDGGRDRITGVAALNKGDTVQDQTQSTAKQCQNDQCFPPPCYGQKQIPYTNSFITHIGYLLLLLYCSFVPAEAASLRSLRRREISRTSHTIRQMAPTVSRAATARATALRKVKSEMLQVWTCAVSVTSKR